MARGKGSKGPNRNHYTRKRPPVVDGFLVRCLGPGREHSFRSRDPSTNRICPRCCSKLDGMRLGKLEEQGVHVESGPSGGIKGGGEY